MSKKKKRTSNDQKSDVKNPNNIDYLLDKKNTEKQKKTRVK